jgi:hypothetical protein
VSSAMGTEFDVLPSTVVTSANETGAVVCDDVGTTMTS